MHVQALPAGAALCCAPLYPHFTLRPIRYHCHPPPPPFPLHRYLVPSLQPYGGPAWTLSCLLPPSAISLFASVLVKHEAVQQVRCCCCCRAVRCAHAWCARGWGAVPLCGFWLLQGLTWSTLSIPVTVEHNFRYCCRCHMRLFPRVPAASP